MSEVKGKIENWNAVYDNKNLDIHFHIKGEMNGIPIHTSRVIKIENNIVTTRNSEYELGFPQNNIYGIEYNDAPKMLAEEYDLMNQKYIEEGAIIDVIKEGRWKGAGMGDFECTYCGKIFSLGHDTDKHFKFCPNCGADMR